MKTIPRKLALFWIILVTLASVAAPFFAPGGYEAQDLAHVLESGSAAHFFGTDQLGRDLYNRIVWGGRLSIALGVGTAVAALILGTLSGAVAGWCAGGRLGWLDRIIMRVVDFIYIFPAVLQAVLLMMLFGRGFTGIFLSLVFSTWTLQARLVRSLVLQIRELPYIEAARAMGLTPFMIVAHHVIPALAAPALVTLTIQIPTNIMAESFLSFLGLGFQPPHSSWGTLAAEGFRAMRSYPHLILYPGSILFVTLAAFTAVGDALQEKVDPSIRSADPILGPVSQSKRS